MPADPTTYSPQFVAFIVAISTVIATFVNVTCNLLQSIFVRRHETKKQLRELAVQLAIEKWKYEAPLRAKMRESIIAQIGPGEELPDIPRISLAETVCEMAHLLESIPESHFKHPKAAKPDKAKG